jgi:anti-sigma regulatory factor (Ser/Thr protein kinase)
LDIHSLSQNSLLRKVGSYIAAEFDEFKLVTEVDYEGPPIPLPETAPSADEIMEPLGELALAGFLIRQHADEVKVTSRDGHTCVHLHFEH